MFSLLLVVGTIAFGVSGAAAAMRAGMDLVGVLVLALVVAVGGGSIRDAALNDLPMWWIDEPWTMAVSAGVAALLIPFRTRFRGSPDSWRIVLFADAVGLAVFVVTGASVALSLGFDSWVAILMGVVTGVGGGVIRDVLVNEKPAILTGQVYAIAGLAGSALFVALVDLGWNSVFVYWTPVFVALAIRVAAISGKWALPSLTLAEPKLGNATEQLERSKQHSWIDEADEDLG